MEFTPAGLEEGVLPLVTRPNRYQPPLGTDGPHDVPAASARVCLVYPGPYEGGMVHPVVRGSYEALRRTLEAFPPWGDEILVDLVFAPGDDLEQELVRRGFPLFGLVAGRRLADYDLLLVVLDTVLALPDLAAMLELGGVPARAASRDGGAPVVALAGEAAWTAAAEPFADLVLVGDPEAFAADLARSLAPAADGSESGRRERILNLLNGALGVALPRAGGTASPAGPQAAVLARWLAEVPPPARLDSFSETAVDGVVLEIARPQGVEDPASPAPPYRFLPVDRAVREAEAALAATGRAEVFFPGAGASRHPRLLSLLEAVNRRFAERGVRVSLEEVDPDVMEPALGRELCRGRRPRLTFAPVAASARLREAVGRPLSRERLLEAVETAMRGAWVEIRLRVLVGLPGETEADRDEFLGLVEEARAAANRRGPSPKVTVETVPFVPRPHGRWAGEAPVDPEDLSRVTTSWRKRLQTRKVRLWARSAETAWLEGTLLQAGRGAARAVEAAAARGLRRQFEEESLDVSAWRALLGRETAVGEENSGDGEGPRIVLDADPVRETQPVSATETGTPPTARDASVLFSSPGSSSGRRVRRAGPGRVSRQADRYRLRFSKDKPLQFTSHLDVTRLFERAFRRARLPVAVSRGKERRLKVSFGPPLPLGMTGSAEVFDLNLAREVPEQFMQAVNAVLPRGLAVTAAAPIRSEVASLNSAIQVADYDVSFPDTLVREYLDAMSSQELRARLEEAVEAALAADVLEVTRVRGEQSRTFNARPSLIGARVVSDEGGRPALQLRLALNRPDSVRPELLTRNLCRWADFDERLLRVHRSGLYIPGRNKVLDPLDVVARGFAWWKETARREAVQ